MDTAPIPTLLRTITGDPGRPRLTWYGPGGERTELSGHVLDNWVTKTTNLLVEEHDAAPGTRAHLDLPPHWRSVVWALAVWRAGAEVVCDAPTAAGGPVDLVVTYRPEEHVPAAPTTTVLGVALPSLARALPAPVPAGVDDATSAALTYGDALGYVPATDATATALTTPAGPVLHGDLRGWWAEPAPTTAVEQPAVERPRVLVTAADDALAPVLARVLAALAVDGSVVLCGPEMTAELSADPARTSRLVESERITVIPQGVPPFTR